MKFTVCQLQQDFLDSKKSKGLQKIKGLKWTCDIEVFGHPILFIPGNLFFFFCINENLSSILKTIIFWRLNSMTPQFLSPQWFGINSLYHYRCWHISGLLCARYFSWISYFWNSIILPVYIIVHDFSSPF